MRTNLSPCPECKSTAGEVCDIEAVRTREPGEKDMVQATCKACGFTVAIRTSRPLQVIREYWNFRLHDQG